MPTRNVNLTDHFDDLVTRLIKSGRFKNVSEAVRAGLHLLECQEREEAAKLEALRRDAAMGMEAYRRGDYTVIEDDKSLGGFFEDLAEETEKA